MQPERTILGDVVFGRTVGFDIRESLREIEGDGDVEYTVNGRPVYLGTPEFRQYELTVSGDGVRPPALARLWRGMIIDPVVPTEEPIDYVLAGETSVELGFDPWPGTVKCVGAVSGARLPHAVVGRVVTLEAAPEEDVEVRARPSFRMMVKSKTQDGQRGRSTSWSVVLTNCPRT